MTSVLNWGISLGKSLSEQYVPEFVKQQVHKQADKMQDLMHDLMTKQMQLTDNIAKQKSELELKMNTKTQEIHSFMFSHMEQLLQHVDQLGDLVLPDEEHKDDEALQQCADATAHDKNDDNTQDEQSTSDADAEQNDTVDAESSDKTASTLNFRSTVQTLKSLRNKFEPRVRARVATLQDAQCRAELAQAVRHRVCSSLQDAKSAAVAKCCQTAQATVHATVEYSVTLVDTHLMPRIPASVSEAAVKASDVVTKVGQQWAPTVLQKAVAATYVYVMNVSKEVQKKGNNDDNGNAAEGTVPSPIELDVTAPAPTGQPVAGLSLSPSPSSSPSSTLSSVSDDVNSEDFE
ncbi:MAG: hypothetical protein MHM6MM_004077 [Cercozoa sp. M6MM]